MEPQLSIPPILAFILLQGVVFVAWLLFSKTVNWTGGWSDGGDSGDGDSD
jgi:hypothetical protein